MMSNEIFKPIFSRPVFDARFPEINHESDCFLVVDPEHEGATCTCNDEEGHTSDCGIWLHESCTCYVGCSEYAQDSF